MSSLAMNTYLLRQDILDLRNVINRSGLRWRLTLQLGEGVEGTLHYGSSSNRPEWLTVLSALTNEPVSIPLARSITGLLVARTSERWFVVSFGHGWQRISPHAIEPNFGIRCVLNLSQRNSLRGIRRDRIADDFLQAIEQIPDGDDIRRFGMDIQRDLLRGVRSRAGSNPTFGTFGSIVSGSDAFKAEINLSTETVKGFLDRCFRLYTADSYKANFEWIDNVSAVRDSDVITALDERLALAVRLGVKSLSLCIPDMLSWDEFDTFSFEPSRRRAPVAVLLDLGHWRAMKKGAGEAITLQSLKDCCVYCYKQGEPGLKKKWTVYECLHGSIRYKQSLYLAHGGHWFRLAKSFVEAIDRQITAIPESGIQLPPVGLRTKEGDYNRESAGNSQGRLLYLDRQNVAYGGGRSSFEICDLLTEDGVMICVKPWGGKSGSLSHLFQQALAAAELIASSNDFRHAASQQITPEFEDAWRRVCDRAVDTEIVLAVLRGPEKNRLPFFAKLALARTAAALERMRYRPTYKQITVA